MFLKISHLLSFSFLIIFSQMSLAQWKGGLQGGINFSTYDIKNKAEDADISTKNGIIIGGIINYAIDNQLEINSGLRYIQKGAHIVFETVNYQANNKAYFNYLEVPFHLKYSFIESSFKPFISAGFDFSYLLLSKIKGTLNGNVNEYENTSDLDKLEISLNGGIGVEYQASDEISYLFGSNYSFSLYKGNNDITNKGIHLLFCVLYKL